MSFEIKVNYYTITFGEEKDYLQIRLDYLNDRESSNVNESDFYNFLVCISWDKYNIESIVPIEENSYSEYVYSYSTETSTNTFGSGTGAYVDDNFISTGPMTFTVNYDSDLGCVNPVHIYNLDEKEQQPPPPPKSPKSPKPSRFDLLDL